MNVAVLWDVATGKEGGVVVIAGALALLVLEAPLALILLLSFAVNLLLFGMWVNPWGRYILVAAPLASVALALVFWRAMRSSWRRQMVIGALVVMALLSLSATLVQERTYWSELLSPDIRNEALYINGLVKQPALIVFLPTSERLGDNQGLRGYMESVSAYNDWVSPDSERARALLAQRGTLPYEGVYIFSDKTLWRLKQLNVTLRPIYTAKARSRDLLEDMTLYEVR